MSEEELLDCGTVRPRGKGSMMIPLLVSVLKTLDHHVGVGSPYEIYKVNGELVLRFPTKKKKLVKVCGNCSHCSFSGTFCNLKDKQIDWDGVCESWEKDKGEKSLFVLNAVEGLEEVTP